MTRARRVTPALAVAMTVAVGAALAACGSPGAAKTAATTPPVNTTVPTVPKTTTTLPAQVAVDLYFVRGSELGVAQRMIGNNTDPRYTAMQVLLGGPTPSEAAAGLSTDIPAGTQMRGLEVRGGTATVNISPEFIGPAPPDVLSARLAQVVYTLTAYSNVQKVAIQVSKIPLPSFAGVTIGQGVGRSQVTAALPPVLLEEPAVGSSVQGNLTVSGATSVNGTYQIQLVDSTGRQVAATTNTAVPGATFRLTLPLGSFTAGVGTIHIFATPSGAGQSPQSTSLSVPIS